MFDKAEWQGQNTFSPDCSDKSAFPWGFDTFELGTVGNAILGWIINTWDEIEADNLRTCVIEEFNWYMNDLDMATKLADAWIADYVELLDVLPNGIMAYEEAVKNWLCRKILPFSP